MGSQIFDYWFDPSNFILEHYVDGDLLDMREPTHHTRASPDNLHVWGEFFLSGGGEGGVGEVMLTVYFDPVLGPEVPATFLQ